MSCLLHNTRVSGGATRYKLNVSITWWFPFNVHYVINGNRVRPLPLTLRDDRLEAALLLSPATLLLIMSASNRESMDAFRVPCCPNPPTAPSAPPILFTMAALPNAPLVFNTQHIPWRLPLFPSVWSSVPYSTFSVKACLDAGTPPGGEQPCQVEEPVPPSSIAVSVTVQAVLRGYSMSGLLEEAS